MNDDTYIKDSLEIRNGSKSQVRDKQTRFLSQAIRLEETVNPHIVTATMSIVSISIVIFLAWAGFANINEVARASGEVVPQGYEQTVQHLEGGLIKSILVQEGTIVNKGQVLAVLDSSGLEEDLKRARSRDATLKMQEERLRAFVENRSPDFSTNNDMSAVVLGDQNDFFTGMRESRQKEEKIIKNQIAQKKQAIYALNSDLKTAQSNLSITQDLYDRRVELNTRGYASDIQLLETKEKRNLMQGEVRRIQNEIEMARREISEYEGRLDSLSAKHRDNAFEKLDQILAQKAENVEVIKKLEARMDRLEVRSPAMGLVKGLNVHTVGAVIQPGETLMDIVPVGQTTHVEVKISPKDIGHLSIGQPVQVKFSTFDFSRYGSVKGKLAHISATTFNGQNGERYYQGRVTLEKSYVGDDPNNVVLPGMTVMADIITGDKTILQYLLKPIHRSMKTAFTER